MSSPTCPQAKSLLCGAPRGSEPAFHVVLAAREAQPGCAALGPCMHCRADSWALNKLCHRICRRPEYRSTAEHMLHLCKDKDYAVPALASAYTLAVSQAAKRFRVRAP